MAGRGLGREGFFRRFPGEGLAPEIQVAAERMAARAGGGGGSGGLEKGPGRPGPACLWTAAAVFMALEEGALRLCAADVRGLLRRFYRRAEELRGKGDEGRVWPEERLEEELPGENSVREALAFLAGEHLAGEHLTGKPLAGEPLAGEAQSGDLSAGRPGLVKEGDWYYLPRFYRDQQALMEAAEERIGVEEGEELSEDLVRSLEAAEGERALDGPRRKAVAKALRYPWVLITGGPGSGKTTTLMTILRALFLQEGDTLSVLLAAPTGRAANRMTESLASQRGASDLDQQIPAEAATLHRLLGLRPGSARPPQYGRTNPLPARVVVVDEASMVDLRMMRYLFEALSPESRLILLGDKDQLPSVEAGSILGDFLQGSDRPEHRLHDQVVTLEKIWRSSPEVLEIARGVIRGDDDAVFSRLQGWTPRQGLPEKAGVYWYPQSGNGDIAGAVKDFLAGAAGAIPVPRELEGLEEYPAAADPDELPAAVRAAVQAAGRMMGLVEDRTVLTPLRRGLLGVEGLNRRLMEAFGPRGRGRRGGWYHGLPLMIRQNDPVQGLYNGDRGVVCRIRGQAFGLFTGDKSRPFRLIPLGLLPAWEPSYAQTIHKSQGSEFKQLFMVIPPGAERLLSREIVYTGLTRTKEWVILAAEEEQIRGAMAKGIRRPSGIPDRLLGS